MWEYKCELIYCDETELVAKMNAFGRMGWEIFSLQTTNIDKMKWNRYDMAMKRKIREGQI